METIDCCGLSETMPVYFVVMTPSGAERSVRAWRRQAWALDHAVVQIDLGDISDDDPIPSSVRRLVSFVSEDAAFAFAREVAALLPDPLFCDLAASGNWSLQDAVEACKLVGA